MHSCSLCKREPKDTFLLGTPLTGGVIGPVQDLPEDVKGRYADPLGGQAVVGWSRGIEALEDGRPDMHKGSFYANPLHDQVTTDAVLLKTFPSYTTSAFPALLFIGALLVSVNLQTDIKHPCEHLKVCTPNCISMTQAPSCRNDKFCTQPTGP